MKKLLTLTAACAALALPFAACGSDDDSGDSGSSADTSAATPPPADTAADTAATKPPADTGKTVEVTMKDIQYVPAEIKVAKGGTVNWTNTDNGIPHTVTYVDGPGGKFDSGTMEQDATFKQTFKESGTVNYVCQIHPNQKGVVTVE